ncbi:MAG: hypothetical protein JNM56_22470 [Planctomycetia bacterium]|nr:hypothetical protein [Planctomycetia bacterium]
MIAQPNSLQLVPAEPPAEVLPSWLIDIERDVYLAATDQPQTVKRLRHHVGRSESRVREAVARLTGCDPPLLIRVRNGVKRYHGSPVKAPVKAPLPADRTAEAVALLRQALALLEGGAS